MASYIDMSMNEWERERERERERGREREREREGGGRADRLRSYADGRLRGGWLCRGLGAAQPPSQWLSSWDGGLFGRGPIYIYIYIYICIYTYIYIIMLYIYIYMYVYRDREAWDHTGLCQLGSSQGALGAQVCLFRIIIGPQRWSPHVSFIIGLDFGRSVSSTFMA